MKTNLATIAHETEGLEESAVAHIRAENLAHVFRMFIRAYSRPVESCFREIASNAADEEKHASRPWRVIMPSRLDARIVFRDWGRGMDHAFVMERAFSVGESTKRGDNSQRGGWGIGLKSVFANAETCTIRVWRGDHVQTYSADMAGGLPNVRTGAAMIERLSPGDDGYGETGTEISWPVKESELQLWRNAASAVLRWFPAGSFEVIGQDITPIKWRDNRGKYSIMDQGENVALIGFVAYPLDMRAIFGGSYDYRLSQAYPSSTLALHIPIGALDIAPNRETLEYTEKTRAVLREALDAAKADIVARFNAEIAHATSIWEMQRAFVEAKHGAGAFRDCLPNETDGLFKVSGFTSPKCFYLTRDRAEKKRPDVLFGEYVASAWQGWPSVRYFEAAPELERVALRLKQAHERGPRASVYLSMPRHVLDAWGVPATEIESLASFEPWRDPARVAKKRDKDAPPMAWLNKRSERAPMTRGTCDDINQGDIVHIVDSARTCPATHPAMHWDRYKRQSIWSTNQKGADWLKARGVNVRFMRAEYAKDVDRAKQDALAMRLFSLRQSGERPPHFFASYQGDNAEMIALRDIALEWIEPDNAPNLQYNLETLREMKHCGLGAELVGVPQFANALTMFANARPVLRALLHASRGAQDAETMAALHRVAELNI